MTIRGEWHGMDRLIAGLDTLVLRVDSASKDATQHVLEQVQRQARTMLSLGWHPPGTPTGSIAPAPPWRISGDLSRSVKVSKPLVKVGEHGWSGQIGATTVYARIQELGGVAGAGHRSRLPARPYLKPAWAIVRPSVRDTFARYWAEAVRR